MGAPGAIVVGTGFGARVHVPALRAAGFDVRALVGRDAERTGRRAAGLGVPQSCTSLAEALTIPGVEAVTIATPPATHAPLVAEVTAAGRHVLCEKPFALDATEARAMLAAATRAGVTHLVGHEFRWNPDRILVARAIRDGLLGEPRTFSLVMYSGLVADPAKRMPEWWFDPSRGGGWLGASGSHLVDQLRTWLGEVAAVSAVLPVVSARRAGAEDSFVILATMRSGVTGVLQQTAASWLDGRPALTAVGGTAGTVMVRGAEVRFADADGTRVLEVPPELALPAPPEDVTDPRERFTHLELGPYTRLCAVLRAGVEGRMAETDVEPDVAPPTFTDGVAVTEVLDAVRASAAAGGARVAVGA
ncbi:MAG: Gfo/Idh/MocA family protein [Actinomycetota bacterium]